MKVQALLRRLFTSARVIRREPDVLFRAPRFVWRLLKEGPRVSLDELRRITDPFRFSSSSANYQDWRDQFGTTDQEKVAMAAWSESLQEPVVIAVLMPVFNPKPEWLQEAIDSVRSQLYPHWQLCIADDCSTDPRIRPLLEAAMAADPRIQVVFREHNGHICASSNSALELVHAPWMALLDHDDLLPDEALIWVAKAIADHPDARLFYSDEDKLGLNGVLFDPYFKGDWNPVLMQAQNMFSHLGVYSTELVRQVGAFRQGFEGSQDHDLVLRCSEQLGRHQIVHIPRVLYHWRVHPQSTASGVSAKSYAVESAERAITEHIQRRGLAFEHMSWSPMGFRVKLALRHPAPRVSVIIPTRNGIDVLRPCLTSLLECTCYPDLEVVVVDNGSDEPSTLEFLKDLEQQGRIQVLRDPSPFNYSELNNRAVQHSSGELICLLNNDIEVIDPGWLEEMVVQVLRPGVGAVGAKLLYPDRTIQHGGVVLGAGGVANHAHYHCPEDHPGYFWRAQLTQEMAAVTGACLLVRRSHYDAVGGLNEEQLKVAFNDVDFCLKLRELGLHNIYAPAATLIHHESVSRGDDLRGEKAERFSSEVLWMMQKWSDQLPNDPYYNPNLSLDLMPFGLSSPMSLASPPRMQRWPSS